MSAVRRLRGKFSQFISGRALGLFLLLALAPGLAHAEPASAELNTYQREDGQTYFALSLIPATGGAPQAEGRDVVILFDTSASQTGIYRETALAAVESLVSRLEPQDRVQLVAVDLEARPITKAFLPARSDELRSALKALRSETPLGSTDMEQVLRSAAERFDSQRTAGRVMIYVGDGVSNANLLGTEGFAELVGVLAAARVPVSSYAIGPQCDAQLLAALANHSGGNLYIAEPTVRADEAEDITEERARQENLRRGATVGAMMADWTRAVVYWPAEVTWAAELGDVYPHTLPPLRSDRDTVVVGATDKPLEKPIEVRIRAQVSGDDVVEMTWSATPHSTGASHAFLAQVVEMARADGGATLPTVGSAGLAETGRMLEAGIDGLTDLAERAVATGDLQAAQVAAQAVLMRDPENVKAQTVQRVVAQRENDEPVPAIERVAQAPPIAADAGDDLRLVRQVPTLPEPPANGQVPADMPPPAPGSLLDRYVEGGAMLDELEEQRRVFAQMLRREVENTVIDARRTMATDPQAAIQDLKLALQNVERAPELSPDMRAQLIDRLQVALREAQRQAVIHDELMAAREEQLAAARERRMLNERLAREQERLRQLVERFNALVDELRFDEAMEVAATVEEVDRTGVVSRVAMVWSELNRNHYLQEVARAARWTNWFDTMYQVELSHIPFPDDPPIVYPAAPVWEELTNRRLDRYGSMDLKATGEAERRIETALRGPLRQTGLEFVDTPLEEVANLLQEEYGIPVQVDVPALEEIGLDPQEPVTISLHNVSLRSALRLMLQRLGLTFIVRDEVMMITTPEEAESQLVVKVYPVADLVLPIDATTLGGLGGGGGGLGGGGGGLGGGGGGFGGGGGGFGGGGGGFGGGGLGGGGGGGGFFSVPDEAAPAKASAEKRTAPANDRAAKAKSPVAAIAVDTSRSPDEFWNDYFASNQADPAAVRETVRQLMGRKQLEHVIALIHAALRHGQPQSWMYESLGIAMELDGRSKSEIERAVMSAADFSTSAEEMMYIAKYLSRLGLDRRALRVYQQVAKVEPLRSEAYALGLRAAERCDDVDGVQWATVGIISQAWPKELAEVELTASRVARALLERLASEGREAEQEAYLKQLQEAVVRDCVVRVSWTGDADVDVLVEEPGGTVCSLAEPRTSSGGVNLGDAYSADAKGGEASEVYMCPKGFAGTYRVLIRRVWGEVAAGKVTVDVYKNLRGKEMQHERRQLELTEKDALVIFDLEQGRRSEPLEVAQLAGAVKRQEAISRSVLAQQLSSGADQSIVPFRFRDNLSRLLALRGVGGAVGYQPIVINLPVGTILTATGVVSADRRYVRIGVAPNFTQIGDVQTFTFAGQADQLGGGGGGGFGGGGGGGGGFGF